MSELRFCMPSYVVLWQSRYSYRYVLSAKHRHVTNLYVNSLRNFRGYVSYSETKCTENLFLLILSWCLHHNVQFNNSGILLVGTVVAIVKGIYEVI